MRMVIDGKEHTVTGMSLDERWLLLDNGGIYDTESEEYFKGFFCSPMVISYQTIKEKT